MRTKQRSAARPARSRDTERHRSHTTTHQPHPQRKPRPARQSHSPRTERVARTSVLDTMLAEALARPEPAPRTFAELGLPAEIVRVLANRGITEPFAIQARAMPDALAGRDVLGRAQTGSGKTLAYGLPMLTRLRSDTRSAPTAPRGLVLVPTRELAYQVLDELAPAAAALDLRGIAVVGGTSIGAQITKLARGADIVIATPGRLIDLMERGAIRLDYVEFAVVDEADHMADLGFLPPVTRILDATPADRQCLLFSATLDRAVEQLVSRFLTDPAVHAASPATASIDAMRHRVFIMRGEEKVALAAEIAARPARTLFFVHTKRGADRLAQQLSRAGVSAAAIHGNLSQNQRLRTLDGFTSGRVPVLVATDVAARGLHVDDLDLVVHYDPAVDHKAYLHRSGRTARAGASGTVLSFVEHHQARTVERLHSSARIAAEAATVHAGHEAVRDIATSGEPIVVTAAAPAPLHRPGGTSNPRSKHRPGRRPRPSTRRGP